MPKVQTLLERKKELDSKVAYLPGDKEAEYTDSLKELYRRVLFYHQAEHRYFNDKSLLAYINRANDDSFLYVPPTPKDNWHSKTRRQTPREKFNAVISAILDQDLSPEVFAWDTEGRGVEEAAEVAEGLLKHAGYLDLEEEKRKLRAQELLKHGTCAVETNWSKLEKVKKRKVSLDDIKQAKPLVFTNSKYITDFEGIWTKIVPLNRVMLGDINKYFIHEQPFLFKEYVMTYDEAYTLFHDWKNWQYVSPVGEENDSWNDSTVETDTEMNQGGIRNFVRMKVYENKWSDEYAILLNNVLMTPVGTPMPTPDKEYSITWTQLEPFDQAFAYGRSFFAILHNDSVILDFLYNAIVDKARQGLEPPLITSFRNMLNKNMFAPGKVSQGDINFKRAVDHNGVTNADIEIARFVEDNIDKSSISPLIQGQGAKGATTAYEIREQQKNALRVLGLTLYSIARMERDLAEKKLAYILEYYPKLKVAGIDKKSKEIVMTSKRFIVHGMTEANGVSRKEISFGEMPESGESTLKALTDMMRQEDESVRSGARLKRIIVDADSLRQLKYVFQLVVNPSQRRSKLADEVQLREDIAFALQLPGIDPVWATRLWLRSKNYDENEAMQKEKPPEQGEMEGGVPPLPQMALQKSQGMPPNAARTAEKQISNLERLASSSPV